MRFLLALAVLLVLFVPMVPMASAQSTLAVDLGEASTVAVDLEADRGGVIRFTADEPADFNNLAGEADSATVELACVCPLRTETIVLTMQRSTNVWTATLSVDDPRLVAGSWLATGKALDQGIAFSTDTSSLEVTGPDVGSLIVRAANTDDAGVVNVGKGQSVQLTVRFQNASPAPLIRSVAYTIGSSASTTWSSPYTLSADNFQPPGRYPMTVRVEDRLGRAAQIGFLVNADTVDPVVTPATPAIFYQGIPNTVTLAVSEHSAFTATARVADAQASKSGTGTQAIQLHLVPDTLGNTVLEIFVRDALGNEVRLLEQTTVEMLRSDIVLVEAVQSDGGAIPSEEVRLKVTARQIDGLADVPVNVTFGEVLLGEMVVNRTQQTSKEFAVAVPPGRHSAMVSLTVPAAVTELNVTNQMANATVERFLARVLYGTERYHIRADESGLPLEAVGMDGTTYEITLEDRGLGTVYAFTANGHDLYWHPASTTTTVPEETTEPEDGNGIPGVPVVGLLGAIGLGAVLRRRRA